MDWTIKDLRMWDITNNMSSIPYSTWQEAYPYNAYKIISSSDIQVKRHSQEKENRPKKNKLLSWLPKEEDETTHNMKGDK